MPEDEQDRSAKIFIKSPTGHGYTLSDAYDIAQTQGREMSPPQPLQDNTREMETALTILLRFSPVPVVADREMTAAALYDPRNKQLAINPGYSDGEAFVAIAAEIAHARFHDKGFNHTYSRESYGENGDTQRGKSYQRHSGYTNSQWTGPLHHS